jgi:HAAS domain-containing protein
VTGSQLIDAYLGQIGAALPGPARTRRDIVAELRSGLLDAADAHRATGMPAAPAIEAAIREFGDPRQVAAGFRPEIAARQARRLALALVATGPLIGSLWAAAALASHIGIRHAAPWHWAGAPPASLVAFPAVAAALLITVWTALFTVAATGRLTRWLPTRPYTATTTAAIAGFGTVAADVAIFVLLASQLATAPSRLAPAPVAAAALASLTRLTLARRAARRCLSTRATLG